MSSLQMMRVREIFARQLVGQRRASRRKKRHFKDDAGRRRDKFQCSSSRGLRAAPASAKGDKRWLLLLLLAAVLVGQQHSAAAEQKPRIPRARSPSNLSANLNLSQQQQQTFSNQSSATNSSSVCRSTGLVGEPDFDRPPGGEFFERDKGANASSSANNNQWQYERNQSRPFGFTEARASDFVRPTFYTLRLKVDPTKRKFTGQLMVALEVGVAAGSAESAASSSALAASASSIDEIVERQQQQQPATARSKSGELGYRYLTLHAGASLHIKRAFYVLKTAGNVQIPATRIGRAPQAELLTLDFHPNAITRGSGLLLIVYAGQVNETDSQGLFLHHSSRGAAAGAGQRSRASAGHKQLDDSGLATHMQPSFARRLFPSWDEPHLKSRFSLIVVLPFRGYQSISNMPIKRKSISLSSCSGEPLQEVEFETTPLMSTYLLTLIIGRFDRIDALTSSNCKITCYVYANQTELANQQALGSQAPSAAGAGAGAGDEQPQAQQPASAQVNAKKQAAQLALDVAVKSFERLEALLGVKYPLQKFDMVALREFNNGGMENWGASIFHENYLLLYEQPLAQNGPSSSPAPPASQEIQVNGGRARARRLVVPLVVAHEVAHQWFGNLLTAASWTYLWLNEGFAQLLMYELADAQFPANNYWLIFLEDSRQAAMHEDELLTAGHALEVELETAPSESAPSAPAVSQAEAQLALFDQLTYNKGAMLVRMLKSLLLGSAQLFAGLRNYLLEHSYGAVTSRQLWQALEQSAAAAGSRAAAFEPHMWAWLRQEGFPLISVQLLAEDADYFRLRLSQERFSLLAPPSAGNSSSAGLWSVPILFASALQPSPGECALLLNSAPQSKDQQQQAVLLSERTSTISLAKSQVGAWFKLNAAALGYYRVEYLGELLQRMRPAIRAKTMDVADRFNLIDDLFAMVRAARRPSGHFLRFLAEAFDEETEPIVMRAIVDALRRIKAAIVSNSADARMAPLFDRYAQKYLRRVVSHSQTAAGKRSASSSSSAAPSSVGANNQQQQQLKRREFEELVDAARISLSNGAASQPAASAAANELVLRALDLFGRHFRQAPSAAPPTTKSPLDWMDRESRASIYAAALMGATGDADLPANFSLLDELRPVLEAGTAAAASSGQDPMLSAYSSLSLSPASTSTGGGAGDTFLRLLRAYESSESAGERYAICSALGTVSQPNKQLKLLELALFEQFFRPSDTQAILETMARQRTGRQLIWQALRTQAKSLARRQLLAGSLRSLWQGFIDPALGGAGQQTSSADGDMENFLRSLYQQHGAEHGNLISQTMELVRINSHWFKQDHDQLLQFLLQAAAGEP